MKKIFALTAGAAVMMRVLSGCSSQEGSFEAKTYVSSEPISGVCIDVSDREIEVSLSGDDLVHIDYFESGEEYYTISVSDDGILNMTAESSQGISRFFGVKSPDEENKISLQIPSQGLASLELHTTNEDISAEDLTAADYITFSNNNGDISFDKLDVGNSLQIENKNGDISGNVVGSFDDFTITAECKKGENTLPASKAGGPKTLNAANNNGDIAIEFVSE